MTHPPSMHLRLCADALREIASGCTDPDLVAREALDEIAASDRACSGWGPEEEQTRRHEDAVTRASETETRADERRHSAWMSPS